MPNFALDDDLRRDFEGAFKVAQTANTDAFLRSFAVQPAETAPENATDKAGEGEEVAGVDDAGEPPALAGDDPDAFGGESVPRETSGNGADALADYQARAAAGAKTRIGPIFKDMAVGVGEAVPQAFGGILSAIDEAAQTLESLVPLGTPNELLGLDPAGTPSSQLGDIVSEPDSVTGGFVRSTAQFLTGFVPAMKAVKGLSLGSKSLQAVEAGTLASLVVFDPHEERLSTYLNTFPRIANLVPDYLADNDPAHEGEWEGRIKNALDQLPLAMIEPAWRVFKYYKAQRKVTAKPQLSATEAGEAAARDAQRDAATSELVAPITEDQLAPLGDAGADFYIKSDKPTLAEAVTDRRTVAAARVKAATERTARVGTLDRIMERVRAHGARIGAEAETVVDDGFDDLLNMARNGIAVGQVARRQKFPLLGLVKARGGVKPGSPLAQELERRGVSRKGPLVGLFRKDGKGAFDNIVASEEGLDHLADPDTGYIDPDKFFDALDEELAGHGGPAIQSEAAFQQEALAREVDTFRLDLEMLGVDFDTMDNAQIRERLEAVEAERGRLEDIAEAPPVTSESEFGGLDPDEGVAPAVGGEPPAPGAAAVADDLPFTHLNYARINTREDVQALLEATVREDAATIERARRGKVSFKQTIKESRNEFQDLSDLIGRPPAGAWNAAQITAARRVLSTSGEQLLDLANRAAAEGATPADLAAFERASAVHFAIQAEVYGARAEAGRALGAWKIQAATDKQRGEQIAELFANRPTGETAAFAKAMAALSDADPAALNSFNRAMSTPTKRGAMFEIWQAALLTGPQTWMVNFLSNVLTSFWAIPERLLAAGVSNVFYNGEVKLGEAASMLYALPSATLDAVKFGAKVGGDPRTAAAFDAFTKTDRAHSPQFVPQTFGADENSVLGMGINYLGMAVRGASFEVLQVGDRFAKGFNYNIELHSLAYRQAADEGLEGQAMAERMRELMLDPPPEIFDAATAAAHERTFTSPLGPTARGFQQFLNKPMLGVEQLPSWRLLVPFYKTPVNILKFTGRRTPLSFAFGSVRRDIQAGGARAAQAWGRIGASSLVMATIAKFTADGVCTGYGPAELSVRKGWLAKNQPYSCKIGGRWFSYRRLDPLGMLFGMSADMAEIMGGLAMQDAEDMTFAPVVAFAQNFASKTWTRGVIGALAALDQGNPTGSPGAVAQDLATSLVPGFIRTIERANDPMMRDTRATVEDDLVKGYLGDLPPPVAEFIGETINRYREQIPGISSSLPPRLDVFGREVDMSSGLGWVYDLASPIASREVGADAVDDVIIENRIKLSLPERTVGDVKLTADEYHAYVKMAGEPAKQELEVLVKSPGFQNLSGGPEGMKATMVKSVISRYRDQATSQMKNRFPQIRARALANKQREIGKLFGAQ